MAVANAVGNCVGVGVGALTLVWVLASLVVMRSRSVVARLAVTRVVRNAFVDWHPVTK